MNNIRAAGILAVVLLVGISIGYFSAIHSSGNIVLKGEVGDTRIGIVEDPASEMPKKAELGDKCKDVVCKPSLVACSGVNSSCNNTCSGGICSSCKPDCKGHETKIIKPPLAAQLTPVPSPTQSATSSSSSSSSSTSQLCTENWTCTGWSACSNNQQNRACTDPNNCGSAGTKPAETQTCTETQQQKQLVVSLSTSNQTMVRGNDIIVTAKVTENQLTPVEATSVEFTMTYASGSQSTNSSITDSQGVALWTKKIGGNSKPGTFRVDAKATKSGYSDGAADITFEVVNATS